MTDPFPTRDVTLREMLAAMAHCKDDETFRWYTVTRLNARGEHTVIETLRVSMGQARAELLG